MEKHIVTKAYVDTEKTIPVPFDDAEIQVLLEQWTVAQDAATASIELSKKKTDASLAAIRRAIPYASNDKTLEESTDPVVIGLVAELKAASEQAKVAYADTLAKAQAVVDIVQQIERLSRLKNPKFN